MIKSSFILHKLVDRIVSITLLAALTASMGCSAIFDQHDPCPEPDEKDDKGSVSIIFRVSTEAETLDNPVWSSRASDEYDHDEEDSDDPWLEDYISLANFGIFIFGGGEDKDDPYLIYSNTNVLANSDDNFFMSGSIGDYTIALDLKNDDIKRILGGDNSDLSPNGDRTLKMKVAVLANINGRRNIPGNYDDLNELKSLISGEDIESVSHFSDFIAIAGSLQYSGATSQAELRIPMYGLETFSISEKDMFYSRPDSRIELGNISMLRAMMKLRVVDHIQQQETGYPKVTGARLTYKYTEGYVTPKDPGSYVNGQQIHYSESIPQSTDGTPNSINLWQGSKEENSLICCAPPQTITYDLPILTIWAQRDAESVPQEFNIEISSIDGITSNWEGTTMIRNHVYTLNVEEVTFGANIKLKATVADWDDAPVFNFDYSDDVSSFADGKITWTPGSYGGTIDGTTKLIMLPWHDGKSVAAECTFGLSTPSGALWTASLIYEGGEPGAFQFVDKDGNPFTDENGNAINTVEGRIDNKIATLRIATVNERPSVDNSVKLQIVVVTQGGNGFTIATDGEILESWTLIQRKISD